MERMEGTSKEIAEVNVVVRDLEGTDLEGTIEHKKHWIKETYPQFEWDRMGV